MMRVLSPRITMSFTAGGGYNDAMYPTDTEPFHAWKPIGSASATLGLSTSWSVQGRYVRDFALLQDVTDQVYTTDTLSVAAGGLVAPRTDLQLGASYSNWTTLLAPGVADRMDIYGASLEVRVALSGAMKAFAGYYYYQHRYSNPGALPAGFPAEYDRGAVRAGISLWTPLVGTPGQPPGTQR
jgi:hypothetical protein